MKPDSTNWATTTKASYATEPRPNHLSNINDTNFARQLRALGQALERFSFSVFDIEVENGIYSVVAKASARGRKGRLSVLRALAGLFRRSGSTRTSRDRPVDLRFTPEEIEKFDLHGKSCREDAGKTPDPYSISQLLRGAGCYLDNRNVSEPVTISFAGQWITIRYETPDQQAANERHDLEYFYDCWVQMYLRRSNRAKLPQASEPTVIMSWQSLQDS
ncbi:MAG TPA: hypothetical protein VFD87_19825 [Phototrophicaceae bacterium]|jgi:hypothetical protein|nr:hypothetical protein [Phototrophicaceae bacterium]